MDKEVILIDHEKRISKLEEGMEAIQKALDTKKLLVYQVLGTILSGVSTAIILNLLIK